MDYVHHMKLLLGPLRRLERLSRGQVSCSLRLILSQLAQNNRRFQHLSPSVHIVPEDDQAVYPCLELISQATRDGLIALQTSESLLLAEFFQLVEKYFLAFDVKRVSLSEMNPEKKPVVSVAERLQELELIVPSLLAVSNQFCKMCLLLFKLTFSVRWTDPSFEERTESESNVIPNDERQNSAT